MIDKSIDIDDLNVDHDFKLNQCVTLVSEAEPNKSVLATCLMQNGKRVLFRLLSDKQRTWGITARNREQIFGMSLLMNPKIKLVSLIGKAGTGKTLMALASGLEQTCEKGNIYHKVVVLRPIIPVGRDIGYLPGDVNSKMAPWVKPVMDNLSVLIGEDKT